MLIVALVAVAISALCVVLARRNDNGRSLYKARTALYASIKSGYMGQPRQVVEDLASAEFYELWSSFIDTGRQADKERLLAQLRKEDAQLELAKRKKNWPKTASILLAFLAAAAILFTAANVLAVAFPRSWFARECHTVHVCILNFHENTNPTGHSPGAVISVLPRSVSQALAPISRETSKHRRHAVSNRTVQPSVPASRPPHVTTRGCGTLVGEALCATDKVTHIAEQCVLEPLENLVNFGTLSTNRLDRPSIASCVTNGLFGSSMSGTTAPGNSPNPSASASIEP